MGNSIKELVRKLVNKYGTRNPFALADAMGIEVQVGNPGCAGCYMFLKNHRYIFLDQNLDEHEMIQVMAHELGHAIMHRKQNCYFIRNKTLLLSKTEIQANMFAAELLISEEDIIEHQSYTIEQMSRVTGYDEKLIELRIKKYNN